MSKRIFSIDLARSIAVLLMVFWQVVDFVGPFDIYNCHLCKLFNMPVHFPVLPIFISMAGASIFLSVSSRLSKGSVIAVFKHVLRRYGGLILVSFFFASFTFGFCTFFSWYEVLQGIGLTGIVLFLILIFKPSFSFLLLLLASLIISQPILKPFLENAFMNFPTCVTFFNAYFPISLFANSFFRSFFSVYNLLSFMIYGVLLVKILRSNNVLKQLFILSLVMFTSSVLLHITGLRIDLYNRSYSSVFLEFSSISFSILIIELLLKKHKSFLDFFIGPFGRHALIAYLAHFLLVYKPLQFAGLIRGFPLWFSFVFSLLFLVFLRWCLLLWERLRK